MGRRMRGARDARTEVGGALTCLPSDAPQGGMQAQALGLGLRAPCLWYTNRRESLQDESRLLISVSGSEDERAALEPSLQTGDSLPASRAGGQAGRQPSCTVENPPLQPRPQALNGAQTWLPKSSEVRVQAAFLSCESSPFRAPPRPAMPPSGTHGTGHEGKSCGQHLEAWPSLHLVPDVCLGHLGSDVATEHTLSCSGQCS